MHAPSVVATRSQRWAVYAGQAGPATQAGARVLARAARAKAGGVQSKVLRQPSAAPAIESPAAS
eukprot:10100817-Lingulodinium_polyedra.AAC.1